MRGSFTSCASTTGPTFTEPDGALAQRVAPWAIRIRCHLGRCCGGRKPAPPGQMLCRTPSAQSRVRRRAGRFWSGLACDDLRLVGLKLIFLIVTRAVSVLGLSRREAWWKDAEILMLRHQLAVDVAGPGVAGVARRDAAGGRGCPAEDVPAGRRCAALCGRWCSGWRGRTSHGDTGGSTVSLPGSASPWRRQRCGRSSRTPGSTRLRAGTALGGRSSCGPRRRGSWRWTSPPLTCSTARRCMSLP
jgi:hypothetical protein